MRDQEVIDSELQLLDERSAARGRAMAENAPVYRRRACCASEPLSGLN
jgi:hypothetical protein